MAKKMSNLEVVVPHASPSLHKKRAAVVADQPSSEPFNSQKGSAESPAQALIGTQVYSSEEQALGVLLESVMGHLADAPESQEEMREFLSMVLDTDPVLKEEILQGVTIRK
jgi:hypothetical protein